MTFQGYEVYGLYARAIGLEQQMLGVIRKTVEESDNLAIIVCPSIHGELFGMVPQEAALQGATVIAVEHSGTTDRNNVMTPEKLARRILELVATMESSGPE